MSGAVGSGPGEVGSGSGERIRTLLVDDERVSRRRIRRLLAADEDVDVIGECSDGADAARRIRRERPDLVFLDVCIPEVEGFDLLDGLDAEEQPLVVFVTAQDVHAARAFDVAAVDYLLKPFSEDRFRTALERAKRRFRQQRSEEFRRRVAELVRRTDPEVGENGPPPRFLVRSSGRIRFVDRRAIVWIEAAGDYVRLHVEDDSYLMRATMRSMEEALPRTAFLRVHRSAIVRLDEIRELRQGGEGEYTVRLADGSELPVSRAGRERLEVVLGQPL